MDESKEVLSFLTVLNDFIEAKIMAAMHPCIENTQSAFAARDALLTVLMSRGNDEG